MLIEEGQNERFKGLNNINNSPEAEKERTMKIEENVDQEGHLGGKKNKIKMEEIA